MVLLIAVPPDVPASEKVLDVGAGEAAT
jgi:hypothetical protein